MPCISNFAGVFPIRRLGKVYKESAFGPIFVHWKWPARMPLGNVFCSCETKSLSVTTETLFSGKTCFCEIIQWHYSYVGIFMGEKALFNFQQAVFGFREWMSNSGTQRSVNLGWWSLGGGAVAENFWNPGNHRSVLKSDLVGSSGLSN